MFRIAFESQFGRDGLFVDLRLRSREGGSEDGGVLRVRNTHLESLKADPPLRPRQMERVVRYLHDDDREDETVTKSGRIRCRKRRESVCWYRGGRYECHRTL